MQYDSDMPYRTHRQRAKVYQKLIEEIDRDDRLFLCHRLKYHTGDSSLPHFPELWEMRPHRISPMGPGIPWGDLSRKSMNVRKEALIKAMACCF